MNVGPGGKQPVMKDTGKVQRLVNDSGIPKGMKLVLQELVLQERGVDTFALKMRGSHEDFQSVQTLVEGGPTYVRFSLNFIVS